MQPVVVPILTPVFDLCHRNLVDFPFLAEKFILSLLQYACHVYKSREFASK